MRKLLVAIAALLLIVPVAVMAGGTQEASKTDEGPIEVHVGLEEIVNAVWAEGEDMGDNLWTRLFLKKHNIKVIVDWVSSEYYTSLNLAIASGELPDAFIVNPVQLHQLAEARQLADIQEAYDQNASVGLKKMMDANKSIVDTARFGDELLALPRLHYGYETATMFVWARKDWKEGLGITEMNTIEDVEDMMQAFMTNYDAEFGIMLDKSLRSFFQIAPSFHSYPQIWITGPDGTIQHGGIQPETKDALARWADWYAKGYVRSDFGTLTTLQMLEDAYNGKVGVFGQANWASWQVGSDMINNQGPDTDFMPMDLPSVDGGKIMYPIAFPNSVYHVVRRGYEYPEVLPILTSEYVYVLDESIIQGGMTIDEALPFNTNHMHHVTGPFKVHFAHYRDIQEVSSSINSGVVELNSGNAYTFYNECMKWVRDGDLVGHGRYIQMGHPESSLKKALKHVDDDHLLFAEMWGVAPQVLRDYGSTLDDLLIEGYTKIITGVEPVNYFDELVEEWKRAGGDRATQAVNEMYGK